MGDWEGGGARTEHRVLAGHPGIGLRMVLSWSAHTLSPLPQFGNSGGPLVNLVSPAACPLAGWGRDVLCAPCSVPLCGSSCGCWEASWKEEGEEGQAWNETPVQCLRQLELMGLWWRRGLAGAGRAEPGTAWTHPVDSAPGSCPASATSGRTQGQQPGTGWAHRRDPSLVQ